MSISIIFLIAFTASIFGAFMTPIQVKVAELLGAKWATTMYLFLGFLASLLIFLAQGDYTLVHNVLDLPYYAYLSGVINIYTLGSMVTVLPLLGYGNFWAASVIGRFTSSLLLNHWGSFSLPQSRISVLKVIATLMIVMSALWFANQKNVFNYEVDSKDKVTENNKKKWPVWVLMVLGVLTGVLQPLMSAINASTSSKVGIIGATIIYLGTGFLVLFMFCIFTEREKLRLVSITKIYHYLPGITNALMVSLPSLFIPMIGVGLYTGISFLATALSSMVFDSIGLWGMPKVPISMSRLLSIGIMLVGITLLRNG